MKNVLKEDISLDELKEIILADYRLACESRETSLLGRREVLTGKAKFGIFGDGKEIAQLAWSKVFKNGDFRSGYYRDQTFMMAIGALSIQEFFASLYADTNHENEPASGGRQMNGHFATQSLDADGNWKSLKDQKNSSPDISPTAAQMPRLLGLAQASKVYRQIESLSDSTPFSNAGNEIAWGTIGNASTSEGHFFETINAAGVLQVPMVISVWDDDYGISVHARHQTTKENISEILKGFQRDNRSEGFEILTAKGWDYPGLIDVYEKAEKIAREKHIPVLIHVREMTQPQGHSTSGSHERYKNEQRLKWEADFDCIKKMKEWMLANALSTHEELSEIENDAKKAVRRAKTEAWKNYLEPILAEKQQALEMLQQTQSASGIDLSSLIQSLTSNAEPGRREIFSSLRKGLFLLRNVPFEQKQEIVGWLDREFEENHERYSAHLNSETSQAATAIEEVKAVYNSDNEIVDARIILRDNFDRILEEKAEVLIFGEDAGKIGDVNQGLEGLQAKHGEIRVADTGIREATILGQGIGMAMRGLRPIAEIQYLDYVLYALQLMSDDLATVRYRTRGRQKAPLIIRTRGHRLEGIWHSGSPMGGIINLVRGIHVLVPRNMTKAAGFYNTLLEADEPALVVECLNGYRLKEMMPSNLSEIRTPLGVIECIAEGTDITVVTYGSNCRIALEAAEQLLEMGISIEIIDVQSLLPFDLNSEIVEHLKKTNRIIFFDEDVEGGASAFMMQQVLEKQGGYQYLDSEPKTLCSKPHRPAYGSDGDYFSKPSSDDLIQTCMEIMHEYDPKRFPNWK
jgi:2-oxoisovalerate dehydrogenase E1 component